MPAGGTASSPLEPSNNWALNPLVAFAVVTLPSYRRTPEGRWNDFLLMSISYPSRLAIWGTAIGLLALFLFSCVQIPAFHHADSQYYVQSALLWPRGEVTFAASWIGSRDLVVFMYHLMFATFGPSVDALSIGLALISLVTNVAIAATVFSLVHEPFAAASVTLAAALIFATLTSAYVTSIMQSPASDNFAVMALACMWALWSLGWRRGELAKLFFWLPLVTGMTVHIRGELIVFPALASLIAAPCIQSIPWRIFVIRSATAAGAFTMGLALPALLWPLWVGAPKPHAYTGAFLIFYPFKEFARGTNGPASAALADQLGLAPEAPIPFWDAIATTYSRFGARVSDDMVTRAGLEAVRRHLGSWLVNGIESAKDILFLPGTISVHRMNWEEQTAAVRTVLEHFDRYRVTTSAQYGNDATAETRKLADQHISILELMRSVIPPVQVQTVLPGLICVVTPLAVLGFAFRLDRYQTVVLLPQAFYAIFILLLGSFTNGSHPRYLAPLLGFDLRVCIICFTNSVRVQRVASLI